MAFLDILKGRKREEVKPQRLPKGAFNRSLSAKIPKEKSAKAEKQGKIRKVSPEKKKKEKKIQKPVKAREVEKETSQDISAKKKTKQPSSTKPARQSGGTSASKPILAAQFLLRPHITEKTSALAERRIYTFKVVSSANKIIIEKAFSQMYGFEPAKTRIINAAPKKRRVRGKIGAKPGFKKALVYLKEGDKIEFI